MTVKELTEQLDLKVFSGKASLERLISGGYVSDLLSDVMGHANEGEVWITLQAHMNVVAIAALKDISALILVKGITPDAAMIEKAEEEGVVMLGTAESTFVTAGKLYKILN